MLRGFRQAARGFDRVTIVSKARHFAMQQTRVNLPRCRRRVQFLALNATADKAGAYAVQAQRSIYEGSRAIIGTSSAADHLV